ncbi:HET-domain-containing protein [Rhizodiscina lignyota]|uniref:HET-domain-containing protein n=1 Tax=Rhizodiscina lignyota TaxID=1504668 RepID=A0A9P4LZX5_9PEZI|nr:HET-domain-containing protein [Rhizodiscina lignyota]
MEEFQYTPLDLDHSIFRLVRLFKGDGSDITCELVHAELGPRNSVIPYEALSYTWGGMEKTATVTVDGKKLPVTLNLYVALQRLQQKDTERILWIDAICIDQKNLEERGHQVKHMADIFRQAETVIYWLGVGTYETKVAMESIKMLHSESLKYACKDWTLDDERWKCLWSRIQMELHRKHSNLLSRQREGMRLPLESPWFERVWILQEVANSQAALVCCGDRSVPARTFALASSLMGITPASHCQAVLDIMPGWSRNGSWWRQNRQLYTLLQKFSGSKASIDRDLIYALLNISSDARDIDRLRVDYNKPEPEVVREVIEFLFNLDISETALEKSLKSQNYYGQLVRK